MYIVNAGLLCLIMSVVAVTGLLTLWLSGCYLGHIATARHTTRQVKLIGILRVILLSLVIFSGLIAVLVSEYYLFQDWAALMKFHDRAQKLIMSSADMRSLFIAATEENAFRINTFADGVGVLLGAILSALGLLGLCLLRSESSNSQANP